MLLIPEGRDITRLKRAEHDLTRQARELAQSNTELERFATIASHDLQQPIRTVSNFVQLLAHRYRDRLDEQAGEYIGIILDGCSRMQTMIRNLLHYAQVGTQSKSHQLVDAEAILTVTLRDLKGVIEDSSAVITHDPLPAICFDPTELAQLFLNLISNALRFRGADPLRVHIAAYGSTDAQHWTFCVSDNGIGIDPCWFDRIFKLFQRLNPRDRYPGTGIGLSICQKIVERRGGRIWVESRPGSGAKFYFNVPARCHHDHPSRQPVATAADRG